MHFTDEPSHTWRPSWPFLLLGAVAFAAAGLTLATPLLAAIPPERVVGVTLLAYGAMSLSIALFHWQSHRVGTETLAYAAALAAGTTLLLLPVISMIQSFGFVIAAYLITSGGLRIICGITHRADDGCFALVIAGTVSLLSAVLLLTAFAAIDWAPLVALATGMTASGTAHLAMWGRDRLVWLEDRNAA
ncbi:hypothetical protein [Tropicimonas sp. S265A]|uniref:hypothetical protein n=1 Tax=Tropicimonas sp. S265A TaxID=3415134 RepID=UPI003C7BC6AB